jgi:hypothetical protein
MLWRSRFIGSDFGARVPVLPQGAKDLGPKSRRSERTSIRVRLAGSRRPAAQSAGSASTPFKSGRFLAIIPIAVKIRNGLDSPFFFAFSGFAFGAHSGTQRELA